MFKQWRFLIIGNRLGLARESTYKFACVHDKGGSEKLRNAISFFRLPKGTNRPNGENNASKNRPPLILLFDSYTSILTKTPQNCIQITYFMLTMASHVDISIRVPLNSSTVAPSSRKSPAIMLPHRRPLETVYTQPVSFSISRILGFEDNSFQPWSYSLLPGKLSSLYFKVKSIF